MSSRIFRVVSITIGIFLLPQISLAQDIEPQGSNSCDYFSTSVSSSKINNVSPTVDDRSLKLEGSSPTNKHKVTVAGLTMPSLWWARQQFDPFGGRLINKWLTNHQVKQIDLTVNWQLWTLLDYLGRYRFINQFGTVARDYGYNLRVFNQQEQCLAIYQYNDESDPPKWEIQLEGVGEDSLQIQSTEEE